MAKHLATQPSAKPTRKVAAGSFAGGVTVIGVWIAGLFGLEVPAEVASAMTVVIGGIVAYFVRDSA